MPLRVVVVDDTAHVREMLVEMLRLDGFEVVGEAADGAEAVRVCSAVEVDIVVCDLRMPKQDGLEVTRRLHEVKPDLPVVIYTAYLDAEVERAAFEAGAVLVLGKVDGLPVLERELVRVARELRGAS
jgi:CheY-like chemotaxis protein